MPALPTLRPTSTGTTTAMTTAAAADISDSSDATFAQTDAVNGTTAVAYWHFTDMPSDFGSMTSVTIHIRLSFTGARDDNWSGSIGFFNNITTYPSLTLPTDTTVVETSYTPTIYNADKATWDAAQLNIFAGHDSNVMAHDGVSLRIHDIWITGTYTTNNRTGTVTSVLPSVTQAGAGKVHDKATIASVLPTFVTDAEATEVGPDSYSAGSNVVLIAVTGQSSTTGTSAQTVSAFNQAASGTYSAAPTLTSTPISSTQIDLSWTAIGGADGYDIERDGTIIIYNHPVTTYSDLGLNADTAYGYRVRAVL